MWESVYDEMPRAYKRGEFAEETLGDWLVNKGVVNSEKTAAEYASVWWDPLMAGEEFPGTPRSLLAKRRKARRG